MKKRWREAVLVTLGGIVMFPVLIVCTWSFMGKAELTELVGPVLEQTQSGGAVSFRLLPRYPTLQAYVELLLDSPEFFVMFWNSVKITAGILTGQLLIGAPAAWGFAKYDFPGKRILLHIYIALMMMPFQVMMLSNYLVLDRCGLLDRQTGVILPAVFSAFPVFLMYRFFTGIPQSLLEAARLDGAGEMKIFIYIGLPLGSSGVISAMVLGFLEYWNMIEQPMAFLKTKSLWPLSLYLPEISMEKARLAFAASAVVLIPALFVFLAGQDYLEQGIISTSVKE